MSGRRTGQSGQCRGACPWGGERLSLPRAVKSLKCPLQRPDDLRTQNRLGVRWRPLKLELRGQPLNGAGNEMQG